MAEEIERKFLVRNQNYRKLGKPLLYQQGFLSTNKNRVVRIRIVGEIATITIKGISRGAIRHEFEYEIPLQDGELLLKSICKKPIIKKLRYQINIGQLTWEVDEFLEENSGLIIAEVELPDEDYRLQLPEWVGDEVTGNKKYYNANLIKRPYSCW